MSCVWRYAPLVVHATQEEEEDISATAYLYSAHRAVIFAIAQLSCNSDIRVLARFISGQCIRRIASLYLLVHMS